MRNDKSVNSVAAARKSMQLRTLEEVRSQLNARPDYVQQIAAEDTHPQSEDVSKHSSNHDNVTVSAKESKVQQCTIGSSKSESPPKKRRRFKVTGPGGKASTSTVQVQSLVASGETAWRQQTTQVEALYRRVRARVRVSPPLPWGILSAWSQHSELMSRCLSPFSA